MSNEKNEMQKEAIELDKEIVALKKEINDYVEVIDNSGRKLLTMDEIMELNEKYDRLTPLLNREAEIKKFLQN